MEHSGELAAVQQELARSFDLTARWVRVVETLTPEPGERIGLRGGPPMVAGMGQAAFDLPTLTPTGVYLSLDHGVADRIDLERALEAWGAVFPRFGSPS
ncbi:MAG TPA: hypothetical protein VIL48_06300 [Acidimicrobiales bacterium]